MSFESIFVDIVGGDPVVQGLAGGLFIALLNALGASVVLVWRDPSRKWLDASLGFAAGVMVSASYTSLLVPGIEFAAAPAYRGLGVGPVELRGIVPVLIGFALGVALLDSGERWAPSLSFLVSSRLTGSGSDAREHDPRLTSVLLFTLAITIHNMPEALAVGVGFGSGDVAEGLSLMLAIGIQNVPEGLAVSVAAVNAGLGRRWYATVAGIRAGLVEVPLAVVGAWAVVVAAPLLPYAMGFAAGGMLYVIVDDIVPATREHGHGRVASLGLMLGAAVMLTLDVVLG